MFRTPFRYCCLVIFFLLGKTICICEGPYLNLCGDYESGLNTTEDAETICDCQQVRFCYLVELFQECNSTTVTLGTAGNYTLSNLQCDILPLESAMRTPAYELLNQTENKIVLHILTDSYFGRYRISCSVFEIFEEFNNTINNKWEIENIDPMEVTIDSEVVLQLAVVKQNNPSQLWCFIKTPDNTIEVYYSSWVSNTQVNCMGFKPVIPGIFQVSLNSLITPDMFDKDIIVRVMSKHPIAQRAKYSLDFEKIFIYFDDNIKLASKCTNGFSKDSLKSFGRDFDCFIRGNTLVVRMGIGYQIVDNVSISSENGFCRAGSSVEFCLRALSVSLIISKPKFSGPTLSLYTNPSCDMSQKYINVKLSPPKLSNYVVQNKTLQTPGKTHRKNLILWRTMRKIQNKFSLPLIIPQTNTTEVLSLLENLSDDLDVGENSVGSASVSIFVQSSASSSSIMAEASVTFCEYPVKLYRYKWIINKKNVFANGKVLIVKNLTPGIYVIKCLVVGCDLGEVLGQGWTTTEILPTIQKVLITPSEITIGETDDISLHAVTQPGTSVSWTCKTALGELCATTTQKLASDVLDMFSLNIFIPGGTFPIGEYAWSVENAEGNIAKVFIKPGNRPAVRVKAPSFVTPSEGALLRGSVKKAQHDCQAWWSSVREKGFSYLNLNNMGEQEEISKNFSIEEMTFVIPPSSGNWRGVESDSTYLFKLQVFCPPNSNNQNGSLDYVKVPLSVYTPPRVSSLTVEPLEGFAMVTNFTVSGGQANVSDSLVYEWSYVDSCDEKTLIKRGVFGRNFTTFLPPGDIQLQLKVCDERGFCSKTSAPNVSVSQESEFPAENFKKARNEIEVLLSSGDTLEAFGMAITTFKSFALIHEPEYRDMVFSTVEEGIRIKMKSLIMRLESDVEAAEPSLEFFEQAVAVAKFFQKGSDIMIQLKEFKDRILKVMDSKKVKRNF